MLFPFLLFFAAYGFDKLFFIGDFPHYFMRSATFVNYDQKDELLAELASHQKKKGGTKPVVLFGNSRTMTFDHKYIEERYPDFTLYNFSVPGGNVDYFHNMMLRFEEAHVRPHHIFFTVTPQGFNDSAKITSGESMLLGTDIPFVLGNISRYRLDDLTDYFAKKMFRTLEHRPNPGVILGRMRNDGYELKRFRHLLTESRKVMKEHFGSYPQNMDFDPVQDREYLERTSRETWENHLVPFTLSESRLHFIEGALRAAKRLQSPVTLLWAKVGPELRRMKDEEPAGKGTIRGTWEPAMRGLAREYDASWLDLNYSGELECDKFYDASHMAAICFYEFTDILIRHMKEYTH